MPAPTPERWADPFRLEPAAAAPLAQALAATPAARSGPRWDSCPAPAQIRQQLRRMVAAAVPHPRLPRLRGAGWVERPIWQNASIQYSAVKGEV